MTNKDYGTAAIIVVFCLSFVGFMAIIIVEGMEKTQCMEACHPRVHERVDSECYCASESGDLIRERLDDE